MQAVFEVCVPVARLTEATASPGAVYLVGNVAALGSWKTTHAIPMTRVDGEDQSSNGQHEHGDQHDGGANGDAGLSKWHVSVPLAECNNVGSACIPIEYKYIIKDGESGAVVSWEAIPGNRTVTVAPTPNRIRGKAATQSSTYTSQRMPCPGARDATLATDGNQNGFLESRCSRTLREVHPWWMVDVLGPGASDSSISLSHVVLWRAMTYHEQPSRPDALPPTSVVTAGNVSSALPETPVWIIVSMTPLTIDEAAHAIEQAKAPLSPSAVQTNCTAFQVLPQDADSRIYVASLNGVRGRYVRVQHESRGNNATSVLQLAQVEVFSSEESVLSADTTIIRRDGLYGVDSAVDGDAQVYVDSDWLDPTHDAVQVRLWVGSFNASAPTVQWFDGSNTNKTAVRVVVNHERRYNEDDSPWRACRVVSGGAAFLDKSTTEMCELQQKLETGHARDACVNSSGNGNLEQWLAWLTDENYGDSSIAIDDAMISKIHGEAMTQTFYDGEVLLHAGRRMRTAFFIREGTIQISNDVGGSILGSVSAGSAFNDLSLLSHWPDRVATFTADGTVVVNVLSFDSFLGALGETNIHRLRRRITLNEAGAKKATSDLDLPTKPACPDLKTAFKQTHYLDANHAQVFRLCLPSNVFSSESRTIERVILNIHAFHADDTGDEAEKGPGGVLLGTAHLLPSQLSTKDEGSLTLPIISNSAHRGVIGQVTLDYLVIRPFVDPRNTISRVWRSYWRPRAPLHGGHRGMGRSFNQVGGFRKALTRENTLASFLLAGRSGADFVEFDVQLTKDRVPVIYHDFFLQVELEDYQARSKHLRPERYTIGVHDLTLRQLTRAQTEAVRRTPLPILQRLVRKHWSEIHQLAAKHRTVESTTTYTRVEGKNVISGTSKRNEEDYTINTDEHLAAWYPRLADLLRHVPEETALNIEIKYPDMFRNAALRSTPAFSMNEYLDVILRCVFTHAARVNGPYRRLFFSCFDPSVVVLLRLKQATFPVFLLSMGKMPPSPVFDSRMTLQFSLAFAKIEKLRGIVAQSDAILATPDYIDVVKREGLVLMSWGDQNTDPERVLQQRHHGVDGIISDNMGDVLRNGGGAGGIFTAT